MIINILEYLEHATKQYPEKIVFSDQENQITYMELLNQSRAIGSYISSELNGKTNHPVAVIIDRNISSLIAFLGIVSSGNYYVPIDPQMPKNRIETMFNTIKPEIILMQKSFVSVFMGLDPNSKTVVFEEAINCSIDQSKLLDIRTRAIDTDPLYAIFTSGSTGIPKSVLVSQRSVIDLVEQFTAVFDFSSNSVFGNQAPFDFDVSVKDIYLTLKNAATMHIIPRVMFSFPGNLIKYINTLRINTVIWATSALRIVANLRALEKEKPQYLQKIMFSGEVMPNKVLNYWRSNLPDPQYVNLYGPTEITCNCSYYVVDRPFADNEVLPIGIPFPNTDIIILNENNELIGKDEFGEICVRGTSLALGYYNNPAESSKSFCQNPLNPYYPERIYRTGDLGKYNDLNELIFIGRKDSQIKHMGHRIELGEIEIAVNSLGFIDAACCLYHAEVEKIVLFYQSQNACDKEIILGLMNLLPKYMIPNKMIHFEKLPMNKNAKIDRAKLSEFFNHASGS